MFEKLIQKLERELHEMESDSVNFKSAGAREAVDELSHAMKCLLTCDAMRNAGGSYGMGGGSYGPNGGSYGMNGGSYGMDGGSYGMDGGSYDYDGGSSGQSSRNRMGQFSRNGSRSYDSGMSGNSDMREVLENLHRNASDPKTRRAIEKAMAEMG